MFNAELDGLHRGRRRERVAEIGKGVVDSFLYEFDLLGRDPAEVPEKSRWLIELAHLNWRLLRTGHRPLVPQQWNQVVDQVGRVPRRESQFGVLEKMGLLKKPRSNLAIAIYH